MGCSSVAEPNRRDFLYIATGATGIVGTTLVTWPLIDQMNPSADVLALTSIEIDISSVQPGQSITVLWRSKPIFIRRLTEREIAEVRSVSVSELLDPLARNANLPDDAAATYENRFASEGGLSGARLPRQKLEWLIVVGICTHLGCIPLANQGDYDGWLCPCHGSEYDTAGRVRVGPAPENLFVPPYIFLSETRVRIG